MKAAVRRKNNTAAKTKEAVKTLLYSGNDVFFSISNRLTSMHSMQKVICIVQVNVNQPLT